MSAGVCVPRPLCLQPLSLKEMIAKSNQRRRLKSRYSHRQLPPPVQSPCILIAAKLPVLTSCFKKSHTKLLYKLGPESSLYVPTMYILHTRTASVCTTSSDSLVRMLVASLINCLAAHAHARDGDAPAGSAAHGPDLQAPQRRRHP